MDIVTPRRRSEMMAGIRGKNTRPELVVRKVAHSLGYRFRIHRKDLPGRPDLVFPGLRKAIQVHGCFWHRHPGCRYAYSPKSNLHFWDTKFSATILRDQTKQSELELLGWEVLVVWECETKDIPALRDHLKRFLHVPSIDV
jgi:DNA mismatch endonuclease (patch repair protein)